MSSVDSTTVATAAAATSSDAPPTTPPEKGGVKQGSGDEKDTPDNKIITNMAKNKQQQLNRFLSKTFHMINECDPSIASWSPDGGSFIVCNVDEFSEKILPLYFKHSKFSSFVRQLNFYGFRKLRLETSVLNKDESKSASVRFFHADFQRDHPDLLHRIQRATKANSDSTASTSSTAEIEALQNEVQSLREQLTNVSTTMDRKLATMQASIELDYATRIARMEVSYQDLLRSVIPQTTGNGGSNMYRHPFSSFTPSPELIAALQQRAAVVATAPAAPEKPASPPTSPSKDLTPLAILSESAASRLSPDSSLDIPRREFSSSLRL